VGHYGLGISRYAHFTSPIRRYPDLVNHRQVHRWLAGEPSGGREGPGHYAEMGEQCTETEIKAMEAERTALQIKCVRFMLPRVGEDFRAVVTGMIRSGFFVELLDFPVEGMVRFASLTDDHYVWEPDKGRLYGRHTGASLHLGDDLEVTLVRADLESRQLEFMPVRPLGSDRAPRRPAPRAGRRR
jgi:ribonuclease R